MARTQELAGVPRTDFLQPKGNQDVGLGTATYPRDEFDFRTSLLSVESSVRPIDVAQRLDTVKSQ
jgi:hypothetical protein